MPPLGAVGLVGGINIYMNDCYYEVRERVKNICI